MVESLRSSLRLYRVVLKAYEGGLDGWKEWVDVWDVDGWMDGWARVGFINIRDIYNNDVGRGGVRVCEAHEVK